LCGFFKGPAKSFLIPCQHLCPTFYRNFVPDVACTVTPMRPLRFNSWAWPLLPSVFGHLAALHQVSFFPFCASKESFKPSRFGGRHSSPFYVCFPRSPPKYLFAEVHLSTAPVYSSVLGPPFPLRPTPDDLTVRALYFSSFILR